MDVHAYLKSGIIERYCLGLTTPRETNELMAWCEEHPIIAKELKESEIALSAYLASFQTLPSTQSRRIVKHCIQENEAWKNAKLFGEQMQLKEFINISRGTNPYNIRRIVKDLHPTAHYENMAHHALYAKDNYELSLVWIKKIVSMEKHSMLDERFLILEGKADCYIDKEIFAMEADDFIQIPPRSHRKVVVTSATPAKVILSRVLL
ncbi:MAG: cupin domain-containing protein [Bacteroidota bacterium]